MHVVCTNFDLNEETRMLAEQNRQIKSKIKIWEGGDEHKDMCPSAAKYPINK